MKSAAVLVAAGCCGAGEFNIPPIWDADPAPDLGAIGTVFMLLMWALALNTSARVRSPSLAAAQQDGFISQPRGQLDLCAQQAGLHIELRTLYERNL